MIELPVSTTLPINSSTCPWLSKLPVFHNKYQLKFIPNPMTYLLICNILVFIIIFTNQNLVPYASISNA